jgi:aminoglycoside 3-N-acetyltransferase
MSRIDPDQPVPCTVDSLAGDMRALGVTAGSTLLVHCSLSAVGYVTGGAHAMVLALLEVLGPDGTLVVPTHSADLSEPSRWVNPPVPELWWPVIRESLPAFDAALTPTRAMGIVADTVRRLPGAVRSSHPAVSFCAVGPNSARVTAHHALSGGLDESSPLARLYEIGADVLLLGVGHGNNTSLHLAEFRTGTRQTTTEGAPVLVDGRREWVTYPGTELDDSDFVLAGAAVAAAGHERVGTVGRATARLLPVRPMVDMATAWFAANRPAGRSGS